MTNEIDINKKYRTRDGREVRIYATEGMGLYPVHGSIFISHEHRDNWSGHRFKGWSLECWLADGQHYQGNKEFDLIEVKPRIKRTFWVNVYPDGVVEHETKEHADKIARKYDRLACVKIEIDCEEGEGL